MLFFSSEEEEYSNTIRSLSKAFNLQAATLSYQFTVIEARNHRLRDSSASHVSSLSNEHFHVLQGAFYELRGTSRLQFVVSETYFILLFCTYKLFSAGGYLQHCYGIRVQNPVF